MSVLSPCWLQNPHFHMLRTAAGTVMSVWTQTQTKSECYHCLFPYFSTNLCFHPQKPMTKNWFFFWAKACLSHTWPWLLSLCSFLKAGLCITDAEWSLTYSYICLVFMLIEEFLFPGYLVSSQKKFEKKLFQQLFSYLYFYFYFKMYFYTEKWLKW